jgi:putative copper resistance protein D
VIVEHSTLHALQVLGLLLALAGPVLTLGLVNPVARSLGHRSGSVDAGRGFVSTTALWTMRGALVSAVSAMLDIAVEAADLDNVTVLGGVDLHQAARFASETTVGRIALLRVGLLLVVAALAYWIRRRAAPERATGAWLLAGVCAIAAVLCAALVSHAAAQPRHRLAAVAFQVGHLTAAALWVGTLMHLLVVRGQMERGMTSATVALLAGVLRRFSSLALAGAGLIAASGLVEARRFLLRNPEAIMDSAYGLTLLVKLSLVGVLLAAGFANFRIVRRALSVEHQRREPGARAALGLLFRTLEIEVTAAVLVVALAGILGAISPPGSDGEGQLTAVQRSALLTPDLPTTRIVDPASWVGAPTRDVNDLRYSEFMHNWSGLVVSILGFAWLLQVSGTRVGEAVGRYWPLVLVPFAVFVAVASDPEVWPLGTVSPWVALRDPLILEHRIGASLILALVWLGWRDARRSPLERPLGKALPVLMIAGSLLLLGHGHSSLGAVGSLTTLINVQHVVLGGLGLFAGTIRWLEIRGVFPHRTARVLWPGLVIAMGLMMAFWYREVV